MCTQCALPPLTADEFGEKLLGILNGGALAVMLSIGHRTGLFDTMSRLPPSTSAEIAGAAGLNERYVREWLGAMTTGGIVVCDPGGPRFSLPAAHAANLTRAAGAANMSFFGQYIAQCGFIEDRIVECFHRGGGVPYEAFPRFHDIMEEDSGQSLGSALLDKVLPLAPGLPERLERGIDVLDIGCGRGRALIMMARHYPRSRFLGLDLSREATGHARAMAAEHGLTNVEFRPQDLTTFDADGPEAAFDLVTAFDAIHDQARPDRVLRGIARTLRPDGTFLMQDIDASRHPANNMDHPLGPLLYTISCMHCMTVSLAQGGLGLGAVWGRETAEEMLREAGFTRVTVNRLAHDVQNCYFVVRRD